METETTTTLWVGLEPALLQAIEELGFTQPTPIQVEAMPPLLAGHDVIGRARTGSGKTAAFGLPILNRMLTEHRPGVRALVLTPTRELALQVSQAFRDLASCAPEIKIATIYGGAPYGPQMRALRRGASIVVGTPGRVTDHFERGSLDLSGVEMFALDEADEMLRMGFIDAVEALMEATPDDRQVALFSATMPPPIRRVADKHLRNPVVIQVEAKAMSTGHINQRWLRVRRHNKLLALIRLLLGEPRGTTLIFARTRADTGRLADELINRGFSADALHGDLNQGARERVLSRLRAGDLDIVVATDVASRGIDVNHITHVINFDLPESTEQYVHRIGRTGRAGREGSAISLVTPGESRRLFQMRGQLRVQIEEMPVPPVAVIEEMQKTKLREKLVAATEGEAAEGAAATLAELMVSGMTAEEVATAALSLLRAQDQIEIPPDPRPREARPPRNNDNNNDVELYLPIGRSRGVRPGDLVGALANEGGIPSSQIGRITIVDHKSFVSMSERAAETILKRLDSVQIRGVDVRVTRNQR
ncbi:MAG: ATP-dependent RNA helicase DeaD [Myxococcota bacterium]|jgi:ATP-dependent RNA helicase DeaD